MVYRGHQIVAYYSLHEIPCDNKAFREIPNCKAAWLPLARLLGYTCKAVGYTREAVGYTREAVGYAHKAVCYNRKAVAYTRKASAPTLL